MHDDRFETRLSGSGGQGLVLAGIILAEAAAVYEGRNAVQTQSYGPESRGGTCKSEVVISSGEIDYPKITRPDLFLAMTQEACDRYAGEVKEGGLAILDTSHVERIPSGSMYCGIPITDIARECVGKAITANMVALGVIVGLTGVVSREALEQAVRSRVPKGTEEINLRAIDAGFEAARHRPHPSYMSHVSHAPEDMQ